MSEPNTVPEAEYFECECFVGTRFRVNFKVPMEPLGQLTDKGSVVTVFTLRPNGDVICEDAIAIPEDRNTSIARSSFLAVGLRELQVPHRRVLSFLSGSMGEPMEEIAVHVDAPGGPQVVKRGEHIAIVSAKPFTERLIVRRSSRVA